MSNRKILKNVIKQSADTLDMYIYDYIQGDYYDFFTGEIKKSETSANYYKEELAKYPNIKNINLYINSGGGVLSEGMAIRNQLLRHPAKVTGHVDGFACSVAAFILTGCDTVKMYSNSMQMIHNAWVTVSGNSKELRKQADDLDQIMTGNRKAFLDKANGKLKEYELKKMLDEETWLTAEECLKYGLADVVISEKVDLTEAKQQLQKLINFNNNSDIAAKLNKKIGNADKGLEEKFVRMLGSMINNPNTMLRDITNK